MYLIVKSLCLESYRLEIRLLTFELDLDIINAVKDESIIVHSYFDYTRG